MRLSQASLSAVAAIFGALLLTMSCVLGGMAIERGTLPPYEFAIGVSGAQILTVVTDDPTCSRPIRGSTGPLCSPGSLFRSDRYYIGWVELQRGSAQRPRLIYRKLFTIRLPAG